MKTDVGARFIAPSPAGECFLVIAHSHAVVIPAEGAMNCAPTSVSSQYDQSIDSITSAWSYVGAQFIAPSSPHVPAYLIIPAYLVGLQPVGAMNCAPTSIEHQNLAKGGKAMTYDPQKHHRRSVRLKNYDYSQPGAYFVTICTEGRQCFFGKIIEGEMHLSGAGQMVHQLWYTLPERFTNVELDHFIIMPNHLHGIIVLKPVEDTVNCASTLGLVLRNFKALTTRSIRTMSEPQFEWQRNYHEHIIRNETNLNHIRQYIIDNPLKWAEDDLFTEKGDLV